MGRILIVRKMVPDERPRERLQLRGPSSLSNGDLLAILLNTGLKGEPVTAVAQRLLEKEQLRIVILDTKHRVRAI
jgi:DNA repair protein RadC